MMAFQALCFLILLTSMERVSSLAGPATIPQWIEIVGQCRVEGFTFFRMPVPLAADCRVFAHCPNPPYARPTIDYCAPGALFQPEIPGCDLAENVDCSQTGRIDPCNGQPDGFRPDTARSKDNRGAVLGCLGGRSLGGVLCGFCEQYGNSETGCVPIPGCLASDFLVPNDCRLEANPNNRSTYYSNGVKSRTLQGCPPGTVYSQQTCGCVEGTLEDFQPSNP